MNLLVGYPEIECEMNLIEEALLSNVHSKQPLVAKTTEELLNAGGKRLRPLLMVLCAMSGCYNRDKIIPLAAAVEILHMATLVHDDIIDEAHLRRGRQTVQSKWGKDIAVFTGDFLLCKAFLLLSKFNDMENTSKMARAVKVVCEGEIQQYHSRYKTELNVTGYLKRIAAKTAVLFSISSYIGSYEGGCRRKVVSAMGKFGMSMGMAFQITDDVLDFTGENILMGKPVSNDFTQGIYTLPIIYALRSNAYSDKMKKCLAKKEFSDDDVRKIISIAADSGGVDYAQKLAKRYIDKARQHLKMVPDGASKEIMAAILNQLIGRKV
ncbi:MAG: polyprenyl synthetase family protein [Clostridia bacterium]